MGIVYETILDNKTLFYYVIIFIAVIFVISKMTIGLSIIFGFIIGSVIIYFLYTDYKNKQDQENKVKSFQESLLLPKPEIITKYEDVIKYLFSIQDFYVHNPEAYQDMVNGLGNFFRIYEETSVNPKYAGRNYELMVEQKRSAMNSLHSVIYNLPTNEEYTEKLNESISIMEQVLQKYLNKVERIQKLYLYENGYSVDTKLINKSGISAFNSFDNDNDLFSYELF